MARRRSSASPASWRFCGGRGIMGRERRGGALRARSWSCSAGGRFSHLRSGDRRGEVNKGMISCHALMSHSTPSLNVARRSASRGASSEEGRTALKVGRTEIDSDQILRAQPRTSGSRPISRARSLIGGFLLVKRVGRAVDGTTFVAAARLQIVHICPISRGGADRAAGPWTSRRRSGIDIADPEIEECLVDALEAIRRVR